MTIKSFLKEFTKHQSKFLIVCYGCQTLGNKGFDNELMFDMIFWVLCTKHVYSKEDFILSWEALTVKMVKLKIL